MALRNHAVLDINKVFFKGFTCHDDLLSVGEFKRKLLNTDRIQVNPDDYYVTENGRIAKEDQPVNPEVVYRVHPRLVGGKGGFGSMLRSLGAQMNKKTTDKNSCRDLTGRRIREVKNEKMLREWLEKEPERERLKRERDEEKKKKKEMKKKTSQGKFFFDSTVYDQQREKIMEDQEKLFRQQDEGLLDFGKPKQTKKNDLDAAKAKRWFGNFHGDDDDDDVVDDDSDDDSDDDDMVQKAKRPRLELESGSSSSMEAMTSKPEDGARHSTDDDDDDNDDDDATDPGNDDNDNDPGNDDDATDPGNDDDDNDPGNDDDATDPGNDDDDNEGKLSSPVASEDAFESSTST